MEIYLPNVGDPFEEMRQAYAVYVTFVERKREQECAIKQEEMVREDRNAR